MLCILIFTCRLSAQPQGNAGDIPAVKTGYQIEAGITALAPPSQATLSGRIIDNNGKPLGGVNIYVSELEKSTITGSDGTFRFYNLHKGLITLECSLISYLTVVQIKDMRQSQNELIIQLNPSTKLMEEVVVTSNHTQLASKIPYTITSISHGEIMRSGQSTLIETLGQKPGVDIISGGSGIGKPVIRGLSFNRIVLYSMGTKIENQQWDDDHNAGVGEAGVDRMEIVYGPSALIYGADALGGAVVFIDEKNPPAGKTTGNLTTGLFSNTAGINLGGGIKHTSPSGFFYSVDLNNQSHTDYLQGNDHSGQLRPFAVNSKYNNFSTKARVGFSRQWGVSKLTYSYLHSLTGMIVEESEDSAATADGNPYHSRGRALQAPSQEVAIQVLSSENTFLFGSSKWNVNGAYQVNNRKEFEPAQPPHLSLGLLLHTFTYDIKWSSSEEKKFGITVGTQGMMQVNKNHGNNIAVPDAVVNDFAGYVLAHYNTGNWNFSGGMRLDARTVSIKATSGQYEGESTLDSMEQKALDSSGLKRTVADFRKQYFPFSFSTGVVCRPADDLSLKLNIATGFSAPNYAELSTFGKHEGTNRFEIGTPNLKAEQNIECDLTANWEHPDFSLNLSGFYNGIRNYIFLSPTTDSLYDLQVIAYTQKNAVIAGSEFSFNVHPRRIKWMQLNSGVTISSGKLAGGGYLPYFPPDKLMTELKFTADSIGKLKHPSLSIVFKNYFAQDNPALYEAPTNGYKLLDVNVGAGINIGKQLVRAYLFCTNFFNTAYFSHLSIVKDIGIYERGRNIGMRLYIPFGN